MSNTRGINVAALAAAIALGIGSTAAMAATPPSAIQLPGQGAVTGNATVIDTNGASQRIGISGNVVINWGNGGADINAGQPGGFNVGSAATLSFVGATPGGGAPDAVLNIDSSGNPSQIMGSVLGQAGAQNTINVFVANANGIIVGPNATVSSAGAVGLIGNAPGATSSFDGSVGSIRYAGAGGDVTVQKGAAITGQTVLIAGGANVNVNLAALKGATGSTSLSAGVASSGGGANNTDASLSVSGALPSGIALGGFNSAGAASNTGTLVLGTYNVSGLFTNSAFLTLPATNGAVYNKGQLTTKVAASFSSLVNDGTFYAKNIAVTGGDLINNNKLFAPNITVSNGNLVNSGSILGVYSLNTASDAKRTSGADYSIINTGTITSYGPLDIDTNRSLRATPSSNNTTGSFGNTGVLQLAKAAKLTIKARNDITLGGLVQTGSGATATNTSATNPIGMMVLSASGFNAAGAKATGTTPTFWTNGVLSVLTPVYVVGTFLHGRQVKVMNDISSVSSGKPNATIIVIAGPAMANDYSFIVGNGATISAKTINVYGSTRTTEANVLLQGKLSASTIAMGSAEFPLDNVYSGPNGGLIVTGSAPSMTLAFTRNVGSAPMTDVDNFRYNYLPISAPSGTLNLIMKTMDYSSTPGSVNLLVDGNVRLAPPAYLKSPAIYGTGSATSPTTIPNTRLVLQATGTIATNAGYFYWPGYVYLGNIGRNTNGSAAAGTLGNGSITLGGKLSNVLPGSTAGDAGIDFITQHPLNLGSYSVTTNANSWVSFGTDQLTQQYATGALGKGAFFGGVQGDGNVVNYGALDPSMFHTDAPVAAN